MGFAALRVLSRPTGKGIKLSTKGLLIQPLAIGIGYPMASRLKLAVWKFASCDGCQLSLLDLEDHLLALAGR